MTTINTGYTKHLVNDNEIFCLTEPEQNYSAYDLFVLKNNLQQWIYNVYKKKYQIIISVKQEDFTLNIVFFLSDGIQNIVLTDQQKEEMESVINKIVSVKRSHILIYTYDSTIINNRKYPEIFLRKFLPYVIISPEFQPIVDSVGIHINLRPFVNHINIFQNILLNINEQLEDIYLKGVVFHPSEEIIKNWELSKYVPIIDVYSTKEYSGSRYSGKKYLSREKEFSMRDMGEDSLGEYLDTQYPDVPLYYPKWVDNRLTYRYSDVNQFLTSRVQGEKYIYFKIGSNNAIRHFTAKLAKKFNLDVIFENEYVKLEINTLKLAQQILSLITEALDNNGGEVFILTYSRPYNLILNESIVSDLKTKMSNIIDTIGYKVTDQDNEYVFSVQIKVDSNYDYIIDLINDYRKLLLDTMTSLKENNPEVIISKKLGGEYKNISIYELIEQRWIESIPKLDLSKVII